MGDLVSFDHEVTFVHFTAGVIAVGIEDFPSFNVLCLQVVKGKLYTVLRACRNPDWFIARDEFNNEGYVVIIIVSYSSQNLCTCFSFSDSFEKKMEILQAKSSEPFPINICLQYKNAVCCV